MAVLSAPTTLKTTLNKALDESVETLLIKNEHSDVTEITKYAKSDIDDDMSDIYAEWEFK